MLLFQAGELKAPALIDKSYNPFLSFKKINLSLMFMSIKIFYFLFPLTLKTIAKISTSVVNTY